MRERLNTLLLFSKPPIPGLVKTRLTRLKDGVFEPEVASTLYHCMLFDVVEICMAAMAKLGATGEAVAKRAAEYDLPNLGELSHSAEGSQSSGPSRSDESILDRYELVISTTPAERLEEMRAAFGDLSAWPRPIVFRTDAGASFDEHYNDAFAQAWAGGSDCILSMGADMPALTEADVIRGFEALHELESEPEGGLVISPDQAMGVSIIGWPRKTDFDHTGVFYNPTGLTVLPAYIAKARERGLPVRYLPAVPDIDTMGDLMHNVTLVEALMYTAPFDDNTPPSRTAKALKEMGWDKIVVPPNELRDPREEIDVPSS